MASKLLLDREDGPSIAPTAQADFSHESPKALDPGFPCSLRGGCALAHCGIQCVVCLAFVAKR